MNQTNQNQTDSLPTLADIRTGDRVRISLRPTEQEEIDAHGEETDFPVTVLETDHENNRFAVRVHHGTDDLIVAHDGTVSVRGDLITGSRIVATDAEITHVISRSAGE